MVLGLSGVHLIMVIELCENWTTMKLESDLLVASMIKDRIGQQKVL